MPATRGIVRIVDVLFTTAKTLTIRQPLRMICIYAAYKGHPRNIQTCAVTFYKIHFVSKYLAKLLLVMLTVLVERTNTVDNIEHILHLAIVTMQSRSGGGLNKYF